MERILHVTYKPGDNRHLPMIRIQGLWLLRCGFCYQDKLKLVIEGEIITITKISTDASFKEGPKRYVPQDLRY